MMKKITFILSLSLVLLLIPFCRVNALQYYVNGTQLGTGVKYYTSGNSNIVTDIRDNNSDFPLFLDLSVVPQYGYVAICSALGNNETRYINSAFGSNISDINIVNSTVGCTIPGVSSYSSSARVVYFTFAINLDFWNCSAQGTSCVWPTNGRLGLTWYQPNSNEYSLVSYGFSSSEPYNFNDSVDPKVKLQEQQNNLINEQNQILEDNLTTCVDSKNLAKPISTVTKSGMTLTNNNDGSYTLNGTSTANLSFYNTGLNLPAGTYTFGMNNSITNNNGSFYFQLEPNGGIRKTFTEINSKYTFNSSSTINAWVIVIPNGLTLNNFIIKPQLEKGSSLSTFRPFGQVCGVSTLEEQNRLQQEQNDFLNDDDVDESSSTGADFFNSFTTNNHGLTGIVSAPLTLIESLTSKTCSPLVLPLPFVNQNIELPCMSSIYSQYFGNFYNMYKVITFGIVSYWVLVRIFALVKDFKNPEHDEIEVMDL